MFGSQSLYKKFLGVEDASAKFVVRNRQQKKAKPTRVDIEKGVKKAM